MASTPHSPRRQLNVFLATPMFPPEPGGGGMHAFYLALALAERPAVRVHVFAHGTDAGPLPTGDKRWLRSRRVGVYRVDFATAPKGVPYAQALEKCLDVYCRVSSKRDFGVWGAPVVHGQHFAGVLTGLNVKARFGVPLIATLHKTPIGDALGATVQDRDPTYAHVSFLAQCPVDAFVAGSEFFACELRKHNNMVDRSRLIYHGVPIAWLQTRARAIPVEQVRTWLGINRVDDLIVCPVRFDERKRPHDLIRAAGLIRKHLPGRSVRLLITGGNEGELKDLARENDVADMVMVKAVPFELMYSVLGLATLCVVPTIREGLGLGVLEALALKKAVVATDVAGVKEILENDQSGCLYAAGEHTHLAYCVEKVLRDTSFRIRMGLQGESVVRQRFSAETMAAQHEELYRSLAGA